MNAFLHRICVIPRCLREILRESPLNLRIRSTFRELWRYRFAMFGPTALSVIILVCGAGWVVHSATLSEPQQSATATLRPGEYLEIPVRSNRARFALPSAKPGTTNQDSNVLVIGSLGNPHRSFRVTVRRIRPHTGDGIQPIRRLMRRKAPASDACKSEFGTTDFHSVDSQRRTGNSSYESSSPSIQSRNFFLHVTDGDASNAAHSAKVRCHGFAANHRVVAYLDQQVSRSNSRQEKAEELIDYVERELSPKMSLLIGAVSDVDADGRLSIVFTPWLDRLQGGKTKLLGLVKPNDFRAQQETPLSNRADVIFLNSSLLDPGISLELAKTILVHEFAHAACISQRLPSANRPHGACSEEDWLHEAQAHLAELRFGQSAANMEHRITEFSAATHRYPLVVDNYYQAGLWRCHGCRGATATFLEWYVSRFGEQAPRELAASSLCGTRNLERVAGMSFDRLFREWTLSLAQPIRHTNQDAQIRRTKSWRDLLSIEPLRLTAASSNMAFEVRGTSAAFVVVELGAPGEQIEVVAEPHARLQISVTVERNEER